MPSAPGTSSLANRHILLGVTGGIACYKSAELVRRLKDSGADVRVVMTRGAEAFVSALTFQAVSGNPVHSDLLDPEAEAGMGHIELAKWADMILIAPASANFIARLAQGRGDDLLSTVCLATESPVSIAPAMNQAMWGHQATQENISSLQSRGVHILGPATGSQACGDVGAGRMLEPLDLVSLSAANFHTGSLGGKKVVISAGPTREAIDPVRYISNHSSGKMGYALAQSAVAAGANVVLISGPVELAPPPGLKLVSITSAADLLTAARAESVDADVFIGAAAVADYRPVEVADQKIKKSADQISIQLVKNPDIISEVAKLDSPPFVVGFAAESENLIEYARGKLERKNLDLILGNDISRSDIGFNQDENEVVLINDTSEEWLPKTSKQALADIIIAKIAASMAN